MEATRTTLGQTGNSVVLMVSKALERGGYYGIRALLVIYMTGEVLAMESERALTIYGYIATILIGTEIVGGLLGDLVLGNKLVAIIGAAIQAIGAFVLCIPSEIALYGAIGLIGLGAGLYSPNVLGMFGKNYFRKDKLMDSGFTFWYLALNAGAFVGIMIIASMGDRNFTLGFILGGIFHLIACAALLLSHNPKIEVQEEESKQYLGKGLLVVLIAVFISALFWGMYELGGQDMFSMQYDIFNAQDSEFWSRNLLFSWNSYTTILFTLLLGAAWMFISMNRFLKLALGFVLAGMAMASLLLVSMNASGMDLALLILAMTLIGIAEVFVAPTILSLITKYSNPKYLAIIMSVAFLPLKVFQYLIGLATVWLLDFTNPGIKVGAGVYLVLAIAIFGISFLFKENVSVTQSNES